jgi:hypothetical protein
MPQTSGAIFLKRLQQALDLTGRNAEQAGDRSAGHSSLNDL